MEAPECSEPDEEKVAEDDFKENDKNRFLKEVDGNNISIISRQSGNKGEDFAGQTIFNEICDKIMLEYLNGDWPKFFYVWDHFFISYVKGLIEYKILTLKLRVHFAILPIRIIQLHQNINFVPGNSSKISIILRGAAEKFSSVDDEEDSEGEQNKLILQNMKQLEDYFNSHDGQKLTKELKDSSFMTFFALPYINNPHEDESVKNIFLIDWLEELSIDLEKFLVRYCQREYLLPEEELKTFNHNSYIDIKESKDSVQPFLCNTSFSNIKNEISSKLTKNDGELIACDRIIHSTIKNKEIENWIANHHHSNEDNNSHTVGTQTRISSIKTGTGFSLISEPHHLASIVTPSIFAISNKQSTLYNDELSITKLRLLNVHKHYRKLKLRFHKLHEDYQKMNEIAEELTIALENSVRGQPVKIDMILQTCTKIFPDRFNRDLQTDSESTSIDLKDLPKDIITTERKKNINSNPNALKLLDYKKIKFNLKSANIKTKLLLLQALRQKLTLTKSNHRDEAIEEYAKNDILGLQGHILNNNEKHILSSILQPINSEVTISFLQQTTSRFLNAIASFSIGRSYLTTGPIVLNAIIKYLDNCNDGIGDGITLDMLLATLQKMSLRKQQRDYMIEANLVEWLIYHLSNENFRMGPYRLEYSCALLMNLSLQSEARSRASVIAPLFVSTMTSLLSTDYVSILPYVNGALQNFLLNYEINEEAKKLHLAEILEYHYVQTRDDLKNHFSQTLKTHKRECAEYLSDDDEFPDEDDELFDVLEKELEENDPIKAEEEELQGENLLVAYYCVRDYHCKLKNISNNEVINAVTESYNVLAKESKKAGFNGSTVIAASETTFSDSKTETIEKKSGTEISKPSKKIGIPKKNEVLFQSKEEEEAFLAKPKLMRTPPSSARGEVNREEIAREIQEKTK